MNVLVVIKVHMKYTNSDFTFIGVATSLGVWLRNVYPDASLKQKTSFVKEL